MSFTSYPSIPRFTLSMSPFSIISLMITFARLDGIANEYPAYTPVGVAMAELIPTSFP